MPLTLRRKSFMRKILFYRIPITLLLFLHDNEETNVMVASKKIDVTYSYLSKLINDLEKHDIISTRCDGRCKYILLTSKGKHISRKLMSLLKLF